jgi:hypothetical protein
MLFPPVIRGLPQDVFYFAKAETLANNGFLQIIVSTPEHVLDTLYSID